MPIETVTKPHTVSRRHRISVAEFEREHLVPGKPVILTGIMDRWPALAKWSPDFFISHHAQAPVCIGEDNLPLGKFMQKVIDSTPENPCPYLKDAVLRRIDPELMHDIEPFVPYCFP